MNCLVVLETKRKNNRHKPHVWYMKQNISLAIVVFDS
jgi:hypothetical protein